MTAKETAKKKPRKRAKAAQVTEEPREIKEEPKAVQSERRPQRITIKIG